MTGALRAAPRALASLRALSMSPSAARLSAAAQRSGLRGTVACVWPCPAGSSLTPAFTGYRALLLAPSRRGIRATGAACAAEPLTVPVMGESITEGTIVGYMKEVGDVLEEDDIVAQIETDKITVDVRSPNAAVLTEILAEDGDVVKVGEAIASLDFSADAIAAATGGGGGAGSAGKSAFPAAMELSSATPPEASLDADAPSTALPTPKPASAPKKTAKPVEPTLNMSESGERRVAMTRMRKRIAERLKEAQNTAAMLTTFNEIDMSSLMDLRNEFKDDFQKAHGAKLGFMSAYVKASAVALQEQPEVNAFIDGGDIVYRDYVDISVAVSTPKGLVVPAIRGCENMNFATVEKTIVSLGERARKGELTIDEMQGGTFTISNGGVFGSLLSTPIINMPQSAILGMHIIQKRPVVVDDQIVIRPMMYVALSYDHRLIDGREAVTFLRRIKTLVEDPRRLLII
jgi:2-oxoglutarate dehydrogenase E2 component (dihydrolipoamide succinyltransferase)